MRRSSLLFDELHFPTNQFSSFLRAIGITHGSIQYIDDELQRLFFPKKGDGQPAERWELGSVTVPCTRNEFRRHLAACGFLLETDPEIKQFQYADWPGALLPRAVARLCDLLRAWCDGVRWEQTVVYGGKRPLQQSEDCGSFLVALGATKAKSEDFVAAYRIWDKSQPKTELELMRCIWEGAEVLKMIHPALSSIPITFVDAPMKPALTEGGPLVRPNTEDTINAWLATRPETGTHLLSSGAPYGMAQDEAFQMILGPKGHEIYTFGHAAPSDLPPENFMREVAGAVHRIRAARGL